MIYFVGAGAGAPDLITVRGARQLGEADVIVFAGALVNPALLDDKKRGCAVYDSARMTLEEVIAVMAPAARAGQTVVRLHTGDPCVYGAHREQMDALDRLGLDYEVCPGVSSFCGAAAALRAEYTLPNVSQTVILTRMEGRTPVPEKEQIESLAALGCTIRRSPPASARRADEAREAGVLYRRRGADRGAVRGVPAGFPLRAVCPHGRPFAVRHEPCALCAAGDGGLRPDCIRGRGGHRGARGRALPRGQGV